MFGVLDRYIGKTIFNTIMTTLFLLVSLSGIIKFVEQLRKTGKGAYSVWDAGYFTLLSVPTDLELFFPMAALLGALLGLGNLAQRSELVVMQAAGFTRLQVAASVMKTAIPLVFLSMAVGEFLAPAGDQLAHNYRSEQIDGSSLLAAQGGLWAKDGNDFIFIQKLQDERHLNGVTVYHFNDQRRLESVRYAASAQWDKHRKEWNLSQIDESNLSNPEQITGSQEVSSIWKTALTPDKLQVVALDPDSLSIRGLHDYIQYLDQTGQKSAIYRLNMWSKIVQPLSVAVMMLMALSFIFGPLRSVSMGQRVVTGISFGFVFYVLDKIFGQLSLVKGLPPVFGAIVPSAVFLALSLVLLIKRK
ncbi:LPS export ABC transporter permease LptG [Rosenbergiella sp. S61]|uniref:LPS export ABC transporter permease LptG n=1 Tax=Rosenbergiella gaditana TaxID=2726987 RepID=A0ABS5T204_9GAMM|nr:LPS export ABC transporter permease LptG [Rosenbergiella gaditana]MBT0725550.1 LPS export ABC transporter permease LptG [Rosenbergiella gaditana]